jgi:Fe-S cluster assembly iron-binding protein IscA
MNWKKFFKSDNSIETKTIEIPPLIVTESAKIKILSELKNQKNLKLQFHIHVRTKKDKIEYLIGFENVEIKTEAIYDYGIPIYLNREDEEFLRGSILDYEKENNQFLIYPDIKVSVENSPNPKILLFYLNRNLIEDSSESPEIGMNRSTFTSIENSNILLFKKLFFIKEIESFVIKPFSISIEYNTPNKVDQSIEELTIDALLSYLTDYPYKLKTINNSIEVVYPKEK